MNKVNHYWRNLLINTTKPNIYDECSPDNIAEFIRQTRYDRPDDQGDNCSHLDSKVWIHNESGACYDPSSQTTRDEEWDPDLGPRGKTDQVEVKQMKFDTNKLINRFFRKVDDVVWDLSTGNLGVKDRSGEILSLTGKDGEDAQVVVNIIEEFGLPIPAFAQNTPVDKVKFGDLLYGSKGVLGWVVEPGEKSIRLLRTDSTTSTYRPPKVQTLGIDSGVMVLQSLVNVLPGGENALGQMQGALLPLMMMGDGNLDDSDMGNMIPMMLMSQSMSGGNSNMSSMMPMLMMMKMMGGKSPF